MEFLTKENKEHNKAAKTQTSNAETKSNVMHFMNKAPNTFLSSQPSQRMQHVCPIAFFNDSIIKIVKSVMTSNVDK